MLLLIKRIYFVVNCGRGVEFKGREREIDRGGGGEREREREIGWNCLCKIDCCSVLMRNIYIQILNR